MLKDKSFHYLWEPKIIPKSYLHYLKTIFKHTSSSQFATEAQIAKIKGFPKKLFCFWEKPQNQPEGPPKLEALSVPQRTERWGAKHSPFPKSK